MEERRRGHIRQFHDTFFTPPDELRVMRMHSSHGHQPFRPLPAPSGAPPYVLQLSEVLPPEMLRTITTSQRMVFHLVGDTGGVKNPQPQINVAQRMVADFDAADTAARPSFFYHMGDVVYFYGEDQEYFPQFYEPYMHYPAPIFAIPGNHDGDLSKSMETAGVHSLAAFVDNFCQHIPHHTRDALDATRHGMTQPNVYWTLDTPLATFVGLYTNVPDGGRLDDDQILWLHDEMAAAPHDRALFVMMHHPIYSMDTVHSGSAYMAAILDEAIDKTARTPDAVFAAHVHNYQRFTRVHGGRTIPYIVAGGGGYHNLHRVSKSVQDFPQQPPFVVPSAPDVTFEAYCDDRYGYLLLDLTPGKLTGTYFAISGAPGDTHAVEIEQWTLDLAAHTVPTSPQP